MFEQVPNQTDFVAQEHEVLDFWDRRDIFDKLRRQNAGGPKWSFLDGPITANNPMGVHHAWGRTYKDAFQRYFAMTGHELRYQNGFDCQGLWVEVEVEKEHGFKTKRDIERYGLEKFVTDCKERVKKFSRVQAEQSVRLGYWMDWDNSYYTMSDENNYTIWGFLKKCFDRNLVYKGADSMPWCARCGTGISQHEMHEGYKEVTDESVIVRLPVRGRENEYLLVWTTTPWTLAANVACAVNPELPYIRAKQGDDVYIVAKGCQKQLKSRGTFEVLEEVPGSQLVDLGYDGPFDDIEAQAEAAPRHRVIPWKDVSAEEGTGIVHIAPGCGKEDFELSKEHDLVVINPLTEDGRYVEGFGALTGKSAREVNDLVFEHLREKGYYYKKEPYTHSYPHCWRCKEPLLFRNAPEWFIDMSWREDIKTNARKIRWIPEWGLDRELEWLDNMRDWMISKKRYWGLALPIYDCECGHFEVIGSKDELRERAVEGWEAFEGHSPHRPWIDNVKIACPQCGRPVSRIEDVGNPWLDAGIVPYSTVKYNTDRDYWKQWIPADLVTECFPGQFRNWFYALLSMSTMMEDIPPFKTLLGHALVKDEHGDDMHKSSGNVIWFDDAAENMGVDVMRWLYCGQNPVQNLNFGYGPGDLVRRKVFNTLWNVYAFFSNYARLDEFDPAAEAVPVAERPDIDRWLLSNLNLLVKDSRQNFEAFNLMQVIRDAEKFIDDLSNWYVRRNRRRFWRSRDEGDRDKLAAYQTLYTGLVTLCKALAPIVPFVTEWMYGKLAADVDSDAPESVHLCPYPEADDSLIDRELSEQMDFVVALVGQVLSLRKAHDLRVRQPLAEVKVASSKQGVRDAVYRFVDQIKEEVNVKSVAVIDDASELVTCTVKPNLKLLGPKYGKQLGAIRQGLAGMDGDSVARSVSAGGTVEVVTEAGTFLLEPEEVLVETESPEHLAVGQQGPMVVALDTTLTDKLKAEGLARDVVRQVQQLRKENDLQMDDRIRLRYRTDSEELRQAIDTWADYIKGETLATELTAGVDGGKSVKVGPGELTLEIEKSA